MLTTKQVAAVLGVSRQMAARHINAGCPTSSEVAAADWYHRNIRTKSDRPRPGAPQQVVKLGNLCQPFSPSDALDERQVRELLFNQILELPKVIAGAAGGLAIRDAQAVRQAVEELVRRWCEVHD